MRRLAEDNSDTGMDLVEYSPWNDVAVDTPIWVRDYDTEDWDCRHFASFAYDRLYAWNYGGTSHTSTNTTPWLQATLENPY